MPAIRLNLPKPHPAQQEILDEAEAYRFKVLDCGRRWGKNILAHNRAIGPALEGYPVGWFCPSYKYLAEDWRILKDILQPVIDKKSETEHRLDLITGGVIEMWSLESGPDVARGRKYKRIIVDEAAMIGILESAWVQAIRPTLADYRGDAWFFSTPKGLNFFYQLYERGQSENDPNWISWKRTTYTNPYIDPAELGDLKDSMTERAFNQEILAEFLKDGGGVFRGVDEAAVLKPADREERHTYVFGVDWGRTNDFTVISVIDACCKRQVYLDRFNQIDAEFQVARLSAVAEKYKPAVILAERNGIGIPMLDLLRRKEHLPVIPWHASNATKQVVVERLSLALEQGQLAILDDPVQRQELLAYDIERLPSGLLRYTAPSGFHDDTVMALCLAWSAAVGQNQKQPKAQPYEFKRQNGTPGWDPFRNDEPVSVVKSDWRQLPPVA